MRATTRQEADVSDDGLLVVPLTHILRLAHPLYGDPWGVGTIDPADVLLEVEVPTECDHDDIPDPWDSCYACEVRRIAHFVVTPPPDQDPHPIAIDVGLSGFHPDWMLLDGNHRIAAAAVRGDTLVTVEAAGDWDRAIALLIDGRDLYDVIEAEQGAA